MCFLYLQLHFFRLKQEQVLPACLALMGPQRDFNRFTVRQIFLSLVPGPQATPEASDPALRSKEKWVLTVLASVLAKWFIGSCFQT